MCVGPLTRENVVRNEVGGHVAVSPQGVLCNTCASHLVAVLFRRAGFVAMSRSTAN